MGVYPASGDAPHAGSCEPVREPRPAPSGEQITIEAEGWRAVVVEVGGGLRSLRVNAEELIWAYPQDGIRPASAGAPLLPWPNRLRDGRYTFAGQEHQLALSEPARGNAIHGLTAWLRWEVRERDPSRVVMGLELPAQAGYPYQLDLEAEYELGPAGLTVRIRGLNLGPTDLPLGVGQHPYLRLGARVDDLELCVPAAAILTTDGRGIPTGQTSVADTDLDFRAPRRIGGAVLDTAFWGLERDPQGRAVVQLGDGAGRRLSLWMDPSFKGVMIFSGDTLAPAARRQSLAVEPMSCPPNALADARDLTVLAPGQGAEFVWGLEASGF